MDLRGLLAFAPLVLLAAAPRAQGSLVLPPSHAAQEGTSSTNVPFGRGTPVRVQCAYDASLFVGPATITSLAFRPDGGAGVAGKQVDVEIRMAHLAAPLVLLGADFAANRGLGDTVVLARQLVTLAAATANGTPGAFLAPIALATPFAYDPAQGGLLVEVTVFGQPPGAYPLDTTWVCTSSELAVGPAGCPQAQAPPLRVESATAQVLWGRPWVARVLDAPQGAFVVLALAFADGGTWNGAPLPVDLAPFGAAGCFVSIDVAGTVATTADAAGAASFPFAIPNDPRLVGEWIRFQAAALHPAANALGVVTSQARRVQVCGFEAVGRVWAADLAAAAGVRELGMAPVVRLTSQ